MKDLEKLMIEAVERVNEFFFAVQEKYNLLVEEERKLAADIVKLQAFVDKYKGKQIYGRKIDEYNRKIEASQKKIDELSAQKEGLAEKAKNFRRKVQMLEYSVFYGLKFDSEEISKIDNSLKNTKK